MNGRKLLALVLFGALVGTGDSAEAPVYIRIIDGFGNHDWRKTTALVREVLERRGDLQVSVSNGKGRIHTSTFGHVWKDEDNPVAFRCGGGQTLMLRAVQWLAKRDVDEPVLADFPTGKEVSLRELKTR